MTRSKGLGPRQRARKVPRLIARDGNRCYYCGCPFGSGKRTLTIDHVIPASAGGTNALDNLRLACERCNGDKAIGGASEYETSARLERRRRAVYREELIALGVIATRKACSHAALEWVGSDQWFCHNCRRTGDRNEDSPARVACIGGVGPALRPLLAARAARN